MKCSACGADVPEGASSCPACGRPLSPATRTTSRVGSDSLPDAIDRVTHAARDAAAEALRVSRIAVQKADEAARDTGTAARSAVQIAKEKLETARKEIQKALDSLK